MVGRPSCGPSERTCVRAHEDGRRAGEYKREHARARESSECVRAIDVERRCASHQRGDADRERLEKKEQRKRHDV